LAWEFQHGQKVREIPPTHVNQQVGHGGVCQGVWEVQVGGPRSKGGPSQKRETLSKIN
jgi:hypothetical protein